MDLSNPVYVSCGELPSKQIESVMELDNPIYVSTSEVSTKVPASSLTFSEPSILQSKHCKRASLVVACIVVILAIAGLSAAMALAFANIREVQYDVQQFKSDASQMALSSSMLELFQDYVDNATQSKIMQLVEDINRMNRTIFELNEVIRNRTEDSMGPPGKRKHVMVNVFWY